MIALAQGKVHRLRRAAGGVRAGTPVPQGQQHVAVGGHIDALLPIEKVPIRPVRHLLRGGDHEALRRLLIQGPEGLQSRALEVLFECRPVHGQGDDEGDAQGKGHLGTELVRPLRQIVDHHKGAVGVPLPQLVQCFLNPGDQGGLVLGPDGPVARDPHRQGDAISFHIQPCRLFPPAPGCSERRPGRTP